MARYCDREGADYAEISYRRIPDGEGTAVRSSCLDDGALARLRDVGRKASEHVRSSS